MPTKLAVARDELPPGRTGGRGETGVNGKIVTRLAHVLWGGVRNSCRNAVSP